MLTPLYYGALIFSMICGVIGWGKNGLSFRILTAVIAYTFVHEKVIQVLHSQVNHSLYAVYAGLALISYLGFMYQHYKSESYRKVLRWAILPLTLIGTVIKLFYIDGFPSMWVSMTNGITVIFSLLLIVNWLNMSFHESLWKDPVFIAAIFIFVYHSVTVVYLSALNYMQANQLPFETLYSTHGVFSILYYGGLGVLLLKNRLFLKAKSNGA